ncbi:MAG: high-affinity branched-chain amino acid ABC transporter permease LivM [Alphaproteobacteria bacterium]|nr:high-affinity branched-chain amino acid ABC transporter permease LivM [Alphaproteobacteria bacterium]
MTTAATDRETPPFAAAAREAALTAAVALALTGPMIGLHAASQATGLVIETRWPEVAIAVALVFLGRFLLALLGRAFVWPVLAAGLAVAGGGLFVPFPNALLKAVCVAGGLIVALRAALMLVRPRMTAAARAKPALAARWVAPAAGAAMTAFALLLPVMPFADRQLLDLATLVVIYILLGWGLNIVVGLAGLLDLGYVAFYAVGAYSFALLAQYFAFSFWEALPLAGLFAAMFGVLLGFPVLRLRGDYLAIVTLGFGEMIRIVLTNWVALTRGPNGISGIPKPSFFGAPFARSPPEGTEAFHQIFDLAFSPMHRVIFLYYVALTLALLANVFILRIRTLPIGRAWEALREDEIACRALGLNPTSIKLSAFSLGAMFGGIAGCVFAARQSFISPESFSFIESAIILAIVVLGGMGSQIGVVCAAVLLIGLPEWFRELQDYRMLAFGGLMVMIMVWRPRGLLSHRDPTVRLPAARETPP